MPRAAPNATIVAGSCRICLPGSHYFEADEPEWLPAAVGKHRICNGVEREQRRTGDRGIQGPPAEGSRMRKSSLAERPHRQSPRSRPPATIDDYVSGFPRTVQALLRKVRQTIEKAAPDARETISYGIPTFVCNGKKLVWFGAFTSHIGFYPGAAAIAAFRKELSGYKTAKGSVQFSFDEPLPLDLIARIVKFRAR